MDVDIPEESQAFTTSKATGKRPVIISVDDAHPFDLEAYISSYTGRTVVDRLIHIISVCPQLANQAYHLAVQHIADMRDTSLFVSLTAAYKHATQSNEELPSLGDSSALDPDWVDQINAKNMAERMRLETELNTYSSNMIRESIRMGQRDLGNFFRSTGDHPAALKHYTKSREFCSTSQHILDMCLSVLELLLEHRNYAHISTYVFKAEAALESFAVAARAPVPTDSASSTAQQTREKKLLERAKIQTKIDAAIALSYLGQGNYEKAATSFLKVGQPTALGAWASTLISPSDIAIYATLCALASFDRSVIRTEVLDNDTFGVYIEQEPYIRELLESYMGNRFKTVLELLERYSTRHYIDMHLYPHVMNLTNLVRSRALVLYFQPFATIRLERMSVAFGWSVEELEQQVVTLIQAGEIQARVDRENKILKAKETDQRAALYAKTMQVGARMQAANRRLLLRMRLQQADIIVRSSSKLIDRAYQAEHYTDIM